MSRALLIVLDSFGCGGAPDADAFGDAGADTFGHIAQACAQGRGDRPSLRAGPLRLPFLQALGLVEAAVASTGRRPAGFSEVAPLGLFGCAIETSKGKDTPSGHWEIAGAPAVEAFGAFPDAQRSFPPDLIADLVREARLPGVLGERHAAGPAIVDLLGQESMRTGKPICYTSVDSVFQIAAHEEIFGLERLYDVCRIARKLCDPLRIGRVIARPFVGDARLGFRRTPNRKDFAVPPPDGNLLDRAAEAGRSVLSLGKIGDIFAHRNTGREIKGADNMVLVDAVLREWTDLPDGGFVFVNLVDFDTDYGHRRDIPGYAACLEAFDARLPEVDARLRAGDLVAIVADHGNDPTWRGTDHTRENAPILCYGPDVAPRALGRRETFADIGASLARWLALPPTIKGTSFLS
jgi:phosphopentomutase